MLLHQAATRDAIHQLFDAVKAISVQGYDEDRRVVYWNVGSELIYGYTRKEALGRKLEELIIPEYMRDHVIAAHQNWIGRGIEIPASEITLCNKSGEEVSVFSSHVLFYDEYNKKEMYCIDIDLAEVRQAQAQLILKENMLQAVFKATPDLFFLMEENGTVIDYHGGDENNLYVSPEKFIGKSISGLLPEKVVSKFRSHTAKVVKQGGVSSFEYELDMPHGPTYFEARISYLKADKKVVVIARDITKKHKSAEVIRKHAYFDSLTLLPNRFLSLDRFILNMEMLSAQKL
ncbi:PAS domain-containing protein [Marinobacter sp. ELB17]|uniref:PAS domain-containing protein n=1 Tax=Marinobacter sp. ELB17 TaxID=270374 RepID=UPI0000F374BC|nr:PAS domain S-box protein [Marinobacter sp. ELB17]EBA00719.1 sensory box/GGDEF/EAL domain protein [Marinobacter sp. ELB17]